MANPIGINTFEAAVFVYIDTVVKIGKSKMTMGTLLTKALNVSPRIKLRRSGNFGCTLGNNVPTGSKAPVLTYPCPATINAQKAIKAWCPNPEKSRGHEWEYFDIDKGKL
ncbi:MAG: hypothetical protein ACJAYB_002241 [Psychromonas sp.]